jgi:hypothetical protein
MSCTQAPSVRRRWLPVLVAFGLLLAACDPVDDSGSPAQAGVAPKDGAQVQSTTTTQGGCFEARPKVSGLLPSLSRSRFRQLTNPCIPFANLTSVVEAAMDGTEQVHPEALESVRTFASDILAVNDELKCAYEKDRLAIRGYQEVGYAWSVGIVVVVRGDFGDVFATAATCYLKNLIPFSDGEGITTAAPGPHPRLCTSARTRHAQEDIYTVLMIGTSTDMCGAFGI